jgi:FixJ family two-component response regulator
VAASETRPTPRIVLLDDDVDFREALGDLLELCCVAYRGVGSLAELQEHADYVLSCSIAILDINLGAGAPSGLDAHRWLLAHGFAGQVAFLTGHAHQTPIVRAAAELPGVRVLQKPLSSDQLLALTREPTP